MDKLKKFVSEHKVEIIVTAVAATITGIAVYKAASGHKMVYGGISFGEIIDSEGYAEGFASTITMNKANGQKVNFDLKMTEDEVKNLAKELVALTKPVKSAAAA